MTIAEWLIPKIKEGLTDSEVWTEYLIDPISGKPDVSEDYVKRYARMVREVLTKADKLISEDPERATRLLNMVEKQNDLQIAIRSYDIKDVAGLRDWANLPPDEWECYSQTVRASQNASTPWFIVEGKFRKRQMGDRTIEELAEKAQSIIESYNPVVIKVPKVSKGDYLLEISLPDLHMGDMNYNNTETVEDKADRFKNAVADFVRRTDNIKLDEIIITFGSDYFTINADKNETAKGTPQDVNEFYDRIYDVGLKTAIDTITTLRGKARTVHVIGLPGNHDEQSSTWLMLCLKYVFQKVKGVEVDWIYDKRKYHIFGVTAIAFVHKLSKKIETQPLLMLQEMIDQGLITQNIKYFEIHGGDLHQPHKQELPAETTNQKITQRVLSSLTDNSRWAKGNFGRKVIEGQAFLYDKKKGVTDCMIYRPENGKGE
jgi:hypothetical protein